MMPAAMPKGCRAAKIRVARRTVTLFASLVSTVSILLVSGCAATTRRPDLRELYNRSAQTHGMERNPVIVIPGILGSKLLQGESEKVVWGAFGGGSANPQKPEGARLVALPMREGAALHELSDDVHPAGVLDRVKVKMFGIPLTLSAYVNILGALGVGGYRDEGLGLAKAIDYGEGHFTCFQFDYDWRRDLVENTRRFHRFLEEKRAYIQAEYAERYGVENHDVKFDVVAHSMGGLLARYYLRYGTADLPADGSTPDITWAGTDLLDRVILIGTPNGGSIETLIDLTKGRKFGPFLPRYPPAVLGTMPAVYQLLPRARHRAVVDAADPGRAIEDLMKPELWARMGWGLADPEQDKFLQMLLPDIPDAAGRRRVALDHLRKCLERAENLAAALDVPATLPEGFRLQLIAGDAVPTAAVATVDPNTGELDVIERQPGDGSVLRSSALMDERVGGEWSATLVTPIDWSYVTFLFTDHLGLTKDPAFTDNVLFILLEFRPLRVLP